MGAASVAIGALAVCAVPAPATGAGRSSRPQVIGYLTEFLTNKLDRFDPATDRCSGRSRWDGIR
jgi:hypothetical protein